MNVIAHLWQSTACAAAAALLILAFRHSSARTRYAIWMFASAKFLVPLSAFVIAGTWIAAWTTALAGDRATATIRWIDRSLAQWNVNAAGMAGSFDLTVELTFAIGLLWASGVAGLAIVRWREWRHVSRLHRTSTPLDAGREAEVLRRLTRSWPRVPRVRLRLSPATFEPGLVGVFQPAILWPAGLSDRLSDAELESVLAHEVCHAARRDNLGAAIQMIVETVFWFHPLVWWLGTRLVHERERACDEEVLKMGTDKQRYAEGILKVCGFCLRQPAALVAGVGGSNLARRIEDILERPSGNPPSFAARVLLAGLVTLVVGTPLAAGIASGHAGAGQQSQEAPQVYRVDKDVKSPTLVKEVKPNYTKAAMQAKIQGVVWLDAVVLANGEVGEVRVTKSLDKEYGLDDEAVRVVKLWRFKPGTKDGKPVAVRVEIEMSFTLKK